MSALPDRRLFLAQLGKGATALAVLGTAACSNEPSTRPATTPSTDSPTSTPSTETTTTSIEQTTTSGQTPGETPTAEPLGWERVDLGFVSAYIVIRSGEAAVVDTGVAGSGPDIERALTAAGVGWEAVGHVVFTHAHPDHIGSSAEVLGRAAAAAAYAGAADIPAIDSPRPVTAVADGDRVFGLDVVATPGHTPGHICLHDREGGMLIAGDALNGDAAGVAGPNPRFSSDMGEANRSVVKLAGLSFEVVVFGHGDPVLSGADAQVEALAADL